MAASTFLIRYFENLYGRADTNNKGKSFKDLLTDAVTLGIRDFVLSVPWSFREKSDTVTTTASTTTVDLPDDFDGIISITEHTTTNGRKLKKYTADEYDRLVPDSESMNEDTPAFYKVYYDFDDSIWKIDLYPTPDSAISLYVSYICLADDAPYKFYPGMVAAVGKYMNPPGSSLRGFAMREFQVEVDRLKKSDVVDVGPISRVLDTADEPRDFDWEEYYRVRSG